MSFILDALRKSEGDRQRLSSVALAELPIGRRHRGQPWWVFALGGLLIVNVVVLAFVLLRDRAPATQTAATPTMPTTAAPATPMPAVQMAPVTQAPAIAPTTRNPLQDATAHVEYETVPASEREIAEAASSVPDGPTLVRPSGVQISDIKPANELAAQGSQELRLDLHVFSRNAKERFVMINMRRYVEGQQMPNGVTVEQITPEGVVLYQNGARYLLGRT